MVRKTDFATINGSSLYDNAHFFAHRTSPEFKARFSGVLGVNNNPDEFLNCVAAFDEDPKVQVVFSDAISFFSNPDGVLASPATHECVLVCVDAVCK
jgi:hypothetical protein